MTTRCPVDKILLISIILLTMAGFFIFLSASTGLLARDVGATFSSIVLNQIVLGLLPGIVAMTILSRINYKHVRKWSVHILLMAIFVTLLVFVPHIGFEHGGAKRWLSIGSHTFQPAEFLKIAVIIYFAALLATVKDKVKTFQWGIVPFIILMSITGGILLLQPDVDTFLVIFASCTAMLFVAGVKYRHLFLLILIGLAVTALMAYAKPYFLSRILTFIDPSADSLGSSYQIQQSMIAVGSGEMWGRGFGQSIQKFNYLPEAIGDSIFAVAGEEFGFVGSTALILLFIFFASRALYISSHAPDAFSKFFIAGVITMIISQSLVNIGAMINILPLSGIPLAFVSHGGTALFFTLGETGIMLNISRHFRA